MDSTDREHMERAILLGRRGWGRVHPNPMVGCILVKEGRVVGEGWHEEYGGAHAEANALARAADQAKGATAYVSLEPCNHFGLTPPCSLALRDAGVSRLVYGAPDPGDESAGGARALREAGVEVVGPVLSLDEARRENPAFFHNSLRHATYVAVKLAQTLDGRVARARGERTTITGREAQVETHRMRAGFDCVMVGSETALVDDPFLTVREEVPVRMPPARVVLDSSARISPGSKLFRDVETTPLIIFTAEDARESSVRSLTEAGARVHRVPGGTGGLHLKTVLETCWQTGIRSVFCEGGPALASSLLGGGHAQRLLLFVAPFVMGETGVPAFPEGAPPNRWEAWDHAAPPRLVGRDVLLTLDRKA